MSRETLINIRLINPALFDDLIKVNLCFKNLFFVVVKLIYLFLKLGLPTMHININIFDFRQHALFSMLVAPSSGGKVISA